MQAKGLKQFQNCKLQVFHRDILCQNYSRDILVPKLLDLGHEVEVLDTQWFGSYLEPHKNLNIMKGDIRDIDKVNLDSVDSIIHLAAIANDPSSDLNPKLTWEVNALSTMQLADKARRFNVERFIYASSSSVYGIKEEEHVTEDLELNPITEYNKTKMVAERVLLSYSNDMVVQIVRPATVCGYSPRMRLDLSVNILTNFAFNKKKIKIFGGDQLRPNLHIKDYCDVVKLFLDAEKEKIANQIFNVGYQNLSINEIATLVKRVVEKEKKNTDEIKIIKSSSNDNRSYHINSDKIKNTLGFIPKRSIEMAITDLCRAFNEGLLPNSFENDMYFNVKRLKKIKAL